MKRKSKSRRKSRVAPRARDVDSAFDVLEEKFQSASREPFKYEPLSCAFCELLFDELTDFSDHIEQDHPHACVLTPDCDLRFTTERELQCHTREVHEVHLGGQQEDEEVQAGGESDREPADRTSDQISEDSEEDSSICSDCAPVVRGMFRKYERLLCSESGELSDSNQNTVKENSPSENENLNLCPKCVPMMKKCLTNVNRRVLQMSNW